MAGARIKTLVAAGAVAVALGAGMLPAYAASTWTVKAGSAANGTTVSIKGVTQGTAPQIHFTDVTTSTKLTCASGTAGGSVTTGTGKAGAGIGKINGASTTWTKCKGPLGIALTPKGTGTWKINAVSYSGGVTTGTITGANATVTGSGCSFTVKGSVPVTYSNSTKVLSVLSTKANLAVSNVTGCFGAVNSGDKSSFAAKYLLTATPAADNPIKITSP